MDSRLTNDERPPVAVSMDILCIKEAAALLRLHPNTVYRMVNDGTLEAFRLGRQWRIRPSAIEAFETIHSNLADEL